MAIRDLVKGNGTWATALKLVLIGFMVLIFLIPLQMIKGLIEERSFTRMDAEQEIVNSWGGVQVVSGPALVIPYITRSTDEKGRTTEYFSNAYVLPEQLIITGTVETERRNRGIFEVTVYTAELEVTGTFLPPNPTLKKVYPEDIQWTDTSFIVELADMRGLQERTTVQWDGASIPFQAGTGDIGAYQGQISAPVPYDPATYTEEIDFSFHLSLHGGKSLSFVPMGSETKVSIRSPWKSPSFNGSFLPSTRDIHDQGFEAEWYVLSLNRGYGQVWLQGEVDPYTILASSFGVEFMTPVDSYLKSLRSVKYGILFIVLPFLVFFLFESTGKRKIHPMQYLLVGFSVCVFFLLLVAVSEHVSFDLTYLIASSATLSVITVYSSAVLSAWKSAWAMALSLGSGYLFLFTALKSEDYALLIGSLGLFVVLSGIMVLTRKMDWYGMKRDTGEHVG